MPALGWIVAKRQKANQITLRLKEVTATLVEIADDIPPPPPGLTSHFKKVEDWFYNICDDKRPKKSIATYEFGLFESPDHYTTFLVGINTYNKEDTSYTPLSLNHNMYFQLPIGEYKNLNRDELLNRLISQLKGLTNTKKFKTSFFTAADKIIFATNGQTIWSKPQ